MKANNWYLFLSVLFFTGLSLSVKTQTTVKGRVYSNRTEVMPGANVYIEGTYDGASSDKDGYFSFTTQKAGEATLVVTYVAYKPYKQPVNLNGGTVELTIYLEENVNRLDAVTISAGVFEASDEKKAVILNSLDIVTTAGAGADVVTALQTLPGTVNVGDKTGLYVRGGEGRETITVIDGLKVSNPFYTAIPDISQRGRFSPFLFQGTFFSTGGYSAEYGQALSSALILNTVGLAEQTFTNIDLMTLGAGGGHNHRWRKTSLGAWFNYTNLNPYNNIVEQNIDWDKSVIGYNGSMMFRHKTTGSGMIKAYMQYDGGDMAFYKQNYNEPYDKKLFSINNNYFFSNASYNGAINGKWFFSTAISHSQNKDDIADGDDDILNTDKASMGKVKFKRLLGDLSSFKFGGEYQHYDITTSFNEYDEDLTEDYAGVFVESDVYLTTKLVWRMGLRGEYSAMVEKANIAPRTSIAYKLGEYSQFSLAYGQYFQTPRYEYLTNNNLNQYEKSTHYILNYQRITEDRTWRVEGFYKQYNCLIKTIPDISADGEGYATGIDVFWRDKKTFKNVDYWISYSFLNTKRKFLDYPKKVMPEFAAKHNVTVVYKHFIPAISTSFGATYVFSSGRPYFNPNSTDFLSDFTKNYNNFSINASYLTSLFGSFTVVAASVSNLFGFENVHGYHFSNNGTKKWAIKDPAKRFFFLGIFISFGRDNSEDI